MNKKIIEIVYINFKMDFYRRNYIKPYKISKRQLLQRINLVDNKLGVFKRKILIK